ncbi:MAG: NifU family protein, partial [Acidimicrobiia bacterium]
PAGLGMSGGPGYVVSLQMSDLSNTDSALSDAAVSEEAASEVDLVKLEEVIEYIRPAIQMDGGDLVLLGVDEGTVNLQMVGACGGCPMSMMTLKAGIERLLTERVPGVTAVNAN